MTYKEAKKEIAIKHGLGNTLVTGHKASYFEEAALLYADQFKKLAQPDVGGRSELLKAFADGFEVWFKERGDNIIIMQDIRDYIESL